MNRKLADIMLLAVAVIWGFGFVGSQLALDAALSPYQIVAGRFTGAALLLVAVFWKEVRKIDKQTLKAGFIIGIFLFLAFITQTIALQDTTPSKNAFLTATNVVMVPFMYWIFSKERPDGYSFFGAIMTIFGIGFLTLDGGFTSINVGDVMTLVCAVFFALHILTTGHYTKIHSPVQLTVIQIGTSALFGIIGMMIESAPITYSAKGLGAILYLAVFSTTLAYLLQNIGQKYTTATKAAIFLSTESVFGTLAAVIFLGDILSGKMVIGCIIIFAAIIITETKLSFLRKGTPNKES